MSSARIPIPPSPNVHWEDTRPMPHLGPLVMPPRPVPSPPARPALMPRPAAAEPPAASATKAIQGLEVSELDSQTVFDQHFGLAGS